MNAAHHLDRSQLYLGYVTGDVRAGDYHRAARAIHRAASHVATAAAVHTHQDSYSWRRMTTVLGGFVRGSQIDYRHLRTFREVYRLPAMLAEAEANGDDTAIRALLRRARRRVQRLHQAVALAIARDPNPLSLADFRALRAAGKLPSRREPQPPPMTTMGQYRRALGLHVPSGTEDHPIRCPCCPIR